MAIYAFQKMRQKQDVVSSSMWKSNDVWQHKATHESHVVEAHGAFTTLAWNESQLAKFRRWWEYFYSYQTL